MLKTIYSLFSVLLISFTFSNAFGNDTGNLQPFNSTTGFYYTVQDGDTLWDLSQKFYSSEWDWPGLWELNDKIKNPHLIYPGQRLRVFFKGGLSLKNKTIYVEPTTPQKQVEVTTEEIEKVEVSKPETVKPEIKLTFSYPFMDQVGFIKSKAIVPTGKILRAKKDYTDLISENDIIYVESSNSDSLIPGSEYQIFETRRIKHKGSNHSTSGILHSIKGIVKILEEKDTYFTAEVTKTYIDMNPGDLIMNFLERDKEFIVQKDNNRIDSQLICNNEDDSMFGERQLVYMDYGKNYDIETGQIYTIYKNVDNKKASFSNTTIKIDPVEIGKLIVLHTEDISSTALIFTNKEEIHPGDPVH